ncbi:MAG: DUF488 domain-containing protein [Anaerovoracaceae bacterium]|jgi:uncharacterized protein YeaO (DUF488 family)
MGHELKTLRVYELGPETEGYRILVDRLWPRGLRKEALEPFVWAKDIAPTSGLRKWFGHDPDRFEEFASRYQEELERSPYAEEFARGVGEILHDQDVLLLYAAKDKEKNQAVVLKKWLEKRLGPGS